MTERHRFLSAVTLFKTGEFFIEQCVAADTELFEQVSQDSPQRL